MVRSYLPPTNGITSKTERKKKKKPKWQDEKATRENGYHLKRWVKQDLLLRHYESILLKPPFEMKHWKHKILTAECTLKYIKYFYCLWRLCLPLPLHSFLQKKHQQTWKIQQIWKTKRYGKLLFIINTQLWWAPWEQLFQKVTNSQEDKRKLDKVHILKMLIIYWRNIGCVC